MLFETSLPYKKKKKKLSRLTLSRNRQMVMNETET